MWVIWPGSRRRRKCLHAWVGADAHAQRNELHLTRSWQSYVDNSSLYLPPHVDVSEAALEPKSFWAELEKCGAGRQFLSD